MTQTFVLPITFYLEVEDSVGLDKLPIELVDALLENLNLSDEVNDMFMDSLQENFPSDIISYRFKL